VTNPTRILLIDDDAVDRAAVRRALRKSGLMHTLTEASGGEEGQRLAAEMAFDCVLLDYRLPGIDTFALLKTLLAAEGDARAVLMLTGEADPELATRLMRAGALDYLDKAEVTPSGLARAIRYAEARRAFQAELSAARGGGGGRRGGSARGKPVNLSGPVCVVIGYRLDKAVKLVDNLPSADYYDADAAHTGASAVSCLEIYCYEILHY